MGRSDNVSKKSLQADRGHEARHHLGSRVRRISRLRSVDPHAERLHSFVYRHGGQYDSYLATEPGRQVFWSTSGQGVISFVQSGRHVLVSGGLIAPEEHKLQLLEEFLEHTTRLNLRATFFCIAEEDLLYFRAVGYRVTKLGEDAIIDLDGLTFGGKQYEWVRRQANFCKRQGLVATEVGPDLMQTEDWESTLAEVLDICQDSLADKPQREELRFFDGRIGEHELGLRRLFIARGDEGLGRIEGFVVCNPILDGATWSTEIYRHRSDAVRGVVPFLFHHISLTLRDEGAKAVNLCLVPGRNCQTPLPGDNPLVRRGLQMGQKYFGLVFDLTGVDHFKSRFRPRYENRYLCAPQKPSLGGFAATLKVFGVFNLDYRKTAQLLWRRLRKRAERRNLSTGE